MTAKRCRNHTENMLWNVDYECDRFEGNMRKED